MHMTHLIIDDFLRDPMAVREQALRLTYPPRDPTAIYPGRNAGRALALYGVEQLIGNIVHEPLTPANEMSHCVPRLALAGDSSKQSVHIDLCHWSAMIYLSLDEHCVEGTHFFRHNASRTDMAPVFPGMAEAAGYPDPDTAVQTILRQSGNNPADWARTMTVPMKFNRLVIFRGYLWHDAGCSFGLTPETGRLILPMFFHNTRPSG